MRRAILAVAIAVWAGSACGGDDSSSDPGELRPAESVRSEEAMAGEHHEMGSGTEVGDATITLSNPAVDGDDFGPWLEVTVRIENHSDETLAPFEFGILCSGSDEEGGAQAEGTLPWAAEIPAGTFDEGTVHLLLPSDGRYGEPRPDCVTPAVIEVEQTGVFVGDEQPVALWALDDELIVAMNADTNMPPS
jgi:hypothetical protein